MNDKKRILLVGSANMNLSMNIARLPAPGETLLDDGGVAYTPGGGGASAAVALTRLGAECILCAKLGKDLHGQKLYNYYNELGINTSLIKVDHDFPTGLSMVIREGDGTSRTVCYPGANTNLTTENILDAFSSMPNAVYLGFETPFSTALSAAKIAAARGIPIFIDASPANKEHPLETLPPIEIFSPNEAETLEYTGILPQGSDSSLRAALALYRKVKCKYLVIKQGARGAFIYDGKHYDMIPAMRPDKIVDTAAAGDAFTAAMTVRYLEGADIKEAVKFGIAASALALSRPGTAESLPTAEEVFDFISRRNS